MTECSANLSVPTLDEKAWRASEPHTPHPRARLEAVGELNRAGIPTGVLIAPLMPGINDSPEQVERILELAAENGATGVGGIALHLRGEVRGVFMDWLRSYRPDLVERYEELYARGAYAPQAERERLTRLVRGARRAAPRRRPITACGARGVPAARDRGAAAGRRREPTPATPGGAVLTRTRVLSHGMDRVADGGACHTLCAARRQIARRCRCQVMQTPTSTRVGSFATRSPHAGPRSAWPGS